MIKWNHKSIKFRVGLRTAKTALAVMVAITLVYFYGVTTSRVIFAMLGAMEAMQPTIKASLHSCLTQVAGVISGAIFGLILSSIGLHPLISTGIGIVLVITVFNAFHVQFLSGVRFPSATRPSRQVRGYPTGNRGSDAACRFRWWGH